MLMLMMSTQKKVLRLSSSLPRLRRNNDRKTATLSQPDGKRPLVANTFGLPSGKSFSCPGATSVCEKICYAGKLEKVFKSTRELLLSNWDAVQNKSVNELQQMIQFMIDDFKWDCDKYNAAKYFRIHWDGDFFSDDYTKAWRKVIKHNKDVQFWVYTRVYDAAVLLKDIPNLSLYYSADDDNKKQATKLWNKHKVKIAYLSDTFDEAKDALIDITGRPGAACPETRQIPLISKDGGACYTCGLCTVNKANVRFAIKKK
jgi:hypothetical protein